MHAKRGDEEEEFAKLAHAKLRHTLGDHFTFIKVLCAFSSISGSSSAGNDGERCYRDISYYLITGCDSLHYFQILDTSGVAEIISDLEH